jgi:hypothetical protein
MNGSATEAVPPEILLARLIHYLDDFDAGATASVTTVLAVASDIENGAAGPLGSGERRAVIEALCGVSDYLVNVIAICRSAVAIANGKAVPE